MLWDVNSGKLMRTSGHTNPAVSGHIDPATSGHIDPAISGHTGPAIFHHNGPVTSAVFSPDEDWIVTSSEDGTFKLWNIKSGECEATISGSNGKVNCLALRKDDGKVYIVTGGEDGSVRQWHVNKDGSKRKPILDWSSSHDTLNVSNASFTDADGLILQDIMLLKKHGASL
ncbi:hypothetical protein BGX27_004366 [Mortierella sp. AM989]|nr:hypothetical protein BGX27_004366 [Mortierella sp. AM989]